MTIERLSIREKILLAAFKATGGDTTQAFTAEQLIVTAWEMDNSAFGLRGFEKRFPDSNRLFTNTDGKDGLVAKGYFLKAGERMFRLAPSGLAAATELSPALTGGQVKLERELATQVNKMISHPVFRDWIKDPAKPKKFSGAGHFWGIAPGTPSRVVRDRLKQIEMTLETAIRFMTNRKINQLFEEHGKVLCERTDIERCLEFHEILKERFAKELRILNPQKEAN